MLVSLLAFPAQLKYIIYRPLVKSALVEQKYNFLISQPKLMFWVTQILQFYAEFFVYPGLKVVLLFPTFCPLPTSFLLFPKKFLLFLLFCCPLPK